LTICTENVLADEHRLETSRPVVNGYGRTGVQTDAAPNAEVVASDAVGVDGTEASRHIAGAGPTSMAASCFHSYASGYFRSMDCHLWTTPHTS